MKTKQNSGLLIKKGALLVLATLLFTACKKDDNAKPPVTQNGKLALLISSPGAPELSFVLGGAKFATSKSLNYNTTIDYLNIKAGTYELAVTKKDATEVLSKVSGTIKNSTNYTFIVTDKSPKAALILVTDDLSAPVANKAKIRFANLSPDAPVLDLYVSGKTESGISKKAFKEVSGFVSVDPATEAKIEIRENSKTDVLATLDKIKIEKGKIYTVYAKGLKDATDATKFGIDIMTNK